MEEKEIGYVSNYFGKISVAAIEITDDTVSIGDTLHFVGSTTDFKMTVDSMQVEHETVSEARKGGSVGLKVPDRVRKSDKVYKVTGK